MHAHKEPYSSSLYLSHIIGLLARGIVIVSYLTYHIIIKKKMLLSTCHARSPRVCLVAAISVVNRYITTNIPSKVYEGLQVQKKLGLDERETFFFLFLGLCIVYGGIHRPFAFGSPRTRPRAPSFHFNHFNSHLYVTHSSSSAVAPAVAPAPCTRPTDPNVGALGSSTTTLNPPPPRSPRSFEDATDSRKFRIATFFECTLATTARV